MKKVLFVLIIALAFTTVFALSVSASENIHVYMNDDYLEFDVPPQVINGRTMVPVRTIFENLGAEVDWNNDTQTITSTKGTTTVVMQIDNYTMKVNGSNIAMDTPPQIVDGRTLVPVRAVAEAFGNRVMWDDEASTVVISDVLYFETPNSAHSYLANWLLDNGKVFSEYVYIQLDLSNNGDNIKISYYPYNGDISLDYLSFNDSSVELTKVSLGNNGTTIYTSGYQTQNKEPNGLQGTINRTTYSHSHPLSYEPNRVFLNDGQPILQFIETTRVRINYLLEQADLLLSIYNTGVTLNALGFKNY